MSATIIDFATHLKNKQGQIILKEKISAAGWTINNDVRNVNSEVCVYLLDSTEKATILFGCKKSDFLTPASNHIIHWGHFVLAWDIIADPQMAFDERHKQDTITFAMKALPSLPEWPSFAKKAFSTSPEHKAHILVIIDRKNLDKPFELIVAHSKAQVMNAISIQSIINNYHKY